MAIPETTGKDTSHPPERLLFPLWAKLGLFYGALVSLAIAGIGLYNFHTEERREEELYRSKLVGLASTMAGVIDGDLHQTFRSARDQQRPEFQRLAVWLQRTVPDNDLKWTGTITRDEHGRFAYVLDSAIQPQPVGYPIFDLSPAHAQAYRGEPAFVYGLRDEWGTWDSAFAPVKNRAGQVVALLEVDADSDARELLWATRRRNLLISLMIGVLLALAGSIAFARTLSRHLSSLTSSARELRQGNFEQTVDIQTRDEIGVLGQAFNSMVHGLKEREFIRETFGRYVDNEVVAKILEDPQSLRLGGEERTVTILMSDLRGFTSLSERLGPEAMVALLNRYFSRMAEVIAQYGGMIDEFAGDGLVVLFGAPTPRGEDELRAAACAVAMQRALHLFNAEEGLELEMGIGLNTGQVIAGNIGSQRRMKWGVVGDPINLAARLESFTVGSQILVSEHTLSLLAGRVETGEVQTIRAKGKREPIRCAYLRRVGAPFDLSLPEVRREQPVTVALPATCFRIQGKQVEEEPLPGCVTQLSTRQVRLRTPWRPEPLANLKLRFQLTPEQLLEELYAKVVEVTPAASGEAGYQVDLRLTSLPERERGLIQQRLAAADDPERLAAERDRLALSQTEG